MADHSELVAEMTAVEKMSTPERLKHAKKRRNAQLKKYVQYEKQLDKESNKRKKGQASKGRPVKKAKTNQVKFVSNIMLLEAAARNDINEVESLLRSGVGPDVTNEDGLTALHQCCIDNLEGLLSLLIKYGANVNAKDSELWTPLHAAATCGHVRLCKILIEHGAEMLAVNADGNMPYDICEDEVTLDYIEDEMAKQGVTQDIIDETRLSSEHKMLADMKTIADEGGDLEFRGRSGETPLHIAAANGYIQVTEFLLEHNVQVDVKDADTWQPIHAAACWGHLPILEMLVQHGADLEARTKNGESPLDISEDPEVRQRIMEIKDEIKSHRASRSCELRRRRSQNSRSASIRRTSLREKMPLALKEAREEAERLRHAAGSTDEDCDDDDDQVETQNEDNTVHNIFMPEEEHSPSEQLDSIQVQLADSNSNKTSSHKENSSRPDEVPSIPSHHAAIETAAKPSGQRKEEVAAEKKPEDANSKMANNMRGATSSSTNQSAESSDGRTSLPGLTSQKAETPASPDIVTPSNRNGPQVSLSSAHSSESLNVPPTGTLADLKKSRAQRLQENLRMKDNTSMHSVFDENSSHNHSSSENSLLMSSSPNGQNVTTHNGVQYKNMYYIAEEAHKHKFTANNSEIIGEDSKTDCCVIL